jgi:fluoroquinolone resistance protein
MTGLRGDFHEDEIFKGLAWDNEELRGLTFANCTFNKCSFKEAAFRACRFQHCTLTRCDLSLATVDACTFSNTRFQDSKLIGIDWTKAAWGKKEIHRLLKALDFYGCVLNYSSLLGLTLAGAAIQKCIAKEVDLSEANLSQADCTYTDFAGSQFRHTDLTEADFTGATNYAINPQLNTLKKTKFSLPEALSLLYSLDIEIREPGDAASAGQGDWAGAK